MKHSIRAMLAAVALSFASVGGLAACTTTPGSAPVIVAPKSVNQSLAEAEITFTGAISATDQMYSTGVITKEQALDLIPTLQKISTALDAAETAVALGNTLAAQADVSTAQDALAYIAGVLLQLKAAAQ